MVGLAWYGRNPDYSGETHMATIPEVEARIHALWAKGDARTLEESVELGQLLTELETEMPPGDFYKHVLDVLPQGQKTQTPLSPRISRPATAPLLALISLA
jgi:hypothetical protein